MEGLSLHVVRKPHNFKGNKMDNKLRDLAECRYKQKEFLEVLHELAVEGQWFDIQHVVQHDMAKAILFDYSEGIGKGYLDSEVFLANWEDVISIGWQAFCDHTGLEPEAVRSNLQKLNQH